jgi:hypothetical protein
LDQCQSGCCCSCCCRLCQNFPARDVASPTSLANQGVVPSATPAVELNGSLSPSSSSSSQV